MKLDLRYAKSAIAGGGVFEFVIPGTAIRFPGARYYYINTYSDDGTHIRSLSHGGRMDPVCGPVGAKGFSVDRTLRVSASPITQYINAAPAAARKKLREIHAAVRKSAPGAAEGLKWGMPAFSYRRILVMFAGFKHHVGFYPTPSAVKAFAAELSGWRDR